MHCLRTCLLPFVCGGASPAAIVADGLFGVDGIKERGPEECSLRTETGRHERAAKRKSAISPSDEKEESTNNLATCVGYASPPLKGNYKCMSATAPDQT